MVNASSRHHGLIELMPVICLVPVVVLFTKYDALLPVALGKLAPSDRQLPLQERLSIAKLFVEVIFDRADVWGRLAQLKHAPRSFVKIGGVCYVFPIQMQSVTLTLILDMQDRCNKVLEVTTDVLTDEALQMLLISAQEANIALCVKFAVQE